MSRRQAVPAGLHHELTEYSSLLRALQTNHTLDLAAQLTYSQPTRSSRDTIDEEGYEDDDEAEDSQPPPTASGSFSQGVPSITQDAPGSDKSNFRAKLKRKAKAKGNARDTWTRWPLLAGDVHVPEWGLEDEVKHIALQYFQKRRQSSEVPPSDPPETTEEPTEAALEDEEDLLTPHALRALTASSSIYLSQLLALLAAHVPPAEKSMKNRVRPINWESVLDIVAANGLADPTVVENVRRSMENIYPASSSRAVERAETMLSIERRTQEAYAPYELSFLTVPGENISSNRPKLKRKRGRYKTRSN